MEYTDYWVAKGKAADVRETLAGFCKKGIVVDVEKKGFVPFVAIGNEKKLVKAFPWLLSVFDAEGSAWGFTLCVDGKEIARGTYGENAEWGIDEGDNGLEGDVAEAATALGTTEKKLSKCLNADGVEKFCTLVGFNHQYMLYPHEKDMPKGVVVWSDDE